MNEKFLEDETTVSLTHDEIQDLDFDETDEFSQRNCCSKCCFYMWCCCCCHSTEKSKNSYRKGWQKYLVKEGNDSSDEPFRILTNFFANAEGAIEGLESIRLNPNLVSANKLRNDLEFYIPQLCTFLLFGEMKAIEEFFVFLCKVCNTSFFFAHRVHWFLSAMINAAQEKKEDIINILKMINTLFKSESTKRRTKINKFYIASAGPYIDYIKKNDLYFLYDPKVIQDQTNILDSVNYNSLNGYQQEIYNKYKSSRELIYKYSDEEYLKAKEKEEQKIAKKNNNLSTIKTEDLKNNDIDNKKFRANDFFIDISNFKLENEDNTYEDEYTEEQVEAPNTLNENSQINIDESKNAFTNIQKSTLDINYVSYHSSINFIDHLCDISNELPKHPIDEQMLYLYKELCEINKKLPCNVYLPFLHESTRNYMICHIPLDGVKIFRTKTRCPIMLTFELIRINETNKENKEDEEFGTTINLSRSKSISSIGSNRDYNIRGEMSFLDDKVKENNGKNMYDNVDYDLSKPLMIQNENKRRYTTYTKKQKEVKNVEKKHEMSILQENEKEEEKLRSSKVSNTSRGSIEENTDEKFHKIVSKFRKAPTNYLREANTIFEPKGLSLDDIDDQKKNKKDDLINTSNIINEEEEDNLSNSNVHRKPSNKAINPDDFKNIFGESFTQKEIKLQKKSLFGKLNSHKIFRCIFKTNEDLRQEQFATQLINEFYQIFKLEKTGCWLNTYEIISTGHDSGLVEMVNDSLSLDQLKQKINHNSLHDFFLYYFGGGDTSSQIYKKAMKNFIASLAGYSLVCYFLQIKDRHNGNILIDNLGHLIHIDFGFLLSNAPGKGLKFENAPFKLTMDMVDCLGGVESKYFKEFRKLLINGYIAVNKHRSKIIILVEMMWCGHGKNLDCFEKGQEAINSLKLRLNPKENMNKKDMIKFVDDLIRQSVGNWRTKWYDMFQYYVQGIFY